MVVSVLAKRELLMFNRNAIKNTTGILIGHRPLKRHLNVTSINNDSTCRVCLNKAETAVHLLFESKGFSVHRFEHLACQLIEPWKLYDIIL